MCFQVIIIIHPLWVNLLLKTFFNFLSTPRRHVLYLSTVKTTNKLIATYLILRIKATITCHMITMVKPQLSFNNTKIVQLGSQYVIKEKLYSV